MLEPWLERRQFPRAPLDRTVDVRLNHWLELRAWGLDVSCGGMCMTLPKRVNRGERMTIGLTFPSELCVELEAVVTNIREQDGESLIGLRWLDADHEVLGILIEDLQ